MDKALEAFLNLRTAVSDVYEGVGEKTLALKLINARFIVEQAISSLSNEKDNI